MAMDVVKSPSEASLRGKAEGDGRWDRTEVETDYPELLDSLHWLLGTEEAKPCLQGRESMAMSGQSYLTMGVTQGGLRYHQEVSSSSTSRFPRARASLSEPEMLIYRATNGKVPLRASQRVLSSEEQQVKALGCQELVSSPSSWCSSAEESILAGSCHDAHAGRWSRRLGAQSPFSSTPELLQPQTPPSPESTPRSCSALCFSTLSSEENDLSEEPSRSLVASTGVPSAATTARYLSCHWGAAEGDRALWVHKPFSPLLDDCTTMERIRKMSSYQADYWACAIPDSFPPSPDRHSPHWNPSKEYEDLLDYAYPLKPRYKLGKVPEPFLHDSGIGLDSSSVTPEGMSRSPSIYSRGGQAQGSVENGCVRFVASAERFSTPGPGKRGCSGANSYSEPLPIAKEVSFAKCDSSHPSRVSSKNTESARLGLSGHSAADGRSWGTRRSMFPDSDRQVKSTSRFLPITRVLPLRKEWEGDEEFLSLPPRLMELERLAQILSNLSLTVRVPGHGHQNLTYHSHSRQPLLASSSPFREVGSRDRRGNSEDCVGLWTPCSSQKPIWENNESSGQIHSDPQRRLHLSTSLRNALDGAYLNGPQVKGHLEKSQQSESLAHYIKIFCCQLEKLINWLYNVVDISSSLVPDLTDAEGVKASLHRCLEFKKNVSDHRSLMQSVMERGEGLLDCMTLNLPALKDTLGLIAKQSEELETHAEHLYASVLAAVGHMQGKDWPKDEGVQQTPAERVLTLSDLCLVGQPQDD